MDCKDIERKIIEAMDGRLSDREADTIRDHVQNCTKCAALQEETMRIREYIDLAAGPMLPVVSETK